MARADTNRRIGRKRVTPGNETFINLQWNIKAVEGPARLGRGSTAPASAWRSLTAESTARIRTWTGTLMSPHPGHSFQASPSTRTSTFWHGTHVAGIIAAEDNSIGTLGIAPQSDHHR